MTREECAAMDIGELKRHIARLQEQKRDTAAQMAFVHTSHGERFFAGQAEAYEKVRNAYRNILKASDADASAEVTLRKMLVNATKEEMLATELDRMKNAEKVNSAIDTELKTCHDVLTLKEEKARTQR